MANEKRLIDANAFEEKLKKFIGGTSIGFVLVGALRNEPTVDAVEVVHGRWIVDESGVIICSECGAEHEWQDYRASFCEDCGAKMDGNGNG